MKAAHRRLVGYILATGKVSMQRQGLPWSSNKHVAAAEELGLVKTELRPPGQRKGRIPLAEAVTWVKVTEKGQEAFRSSMPRKPKQDPLAKLPTLELVTHLKRTPADWPRGYRILATLWPGQADFERQMRDAVNGTRMATAGRGEARLEPVAIDAMEKGKPYIVTGGGGVWFSRGPIEPDETLKAYLVIVP
jgi:hypothetical protein